MSLPQKLHSLDRDVFYAARILWLSSANLSLARVRPQKNHQSKLQSADGQWKNDGGIKERKHARDQSIVNLQETDCCAENAKHIKKIAVSPHILDYRRPLVLIGVARSKNQKENPKGARTRCTSSKWKAVSV